MSEQPRRRRRQIETEIVSIADIPKTTQEESFVSAREMPVMPEPKVIKKTSKMHLSMPTQKEEQEKRIGVACLVAAGVYVITSTVDICINSTFTLYILCASLAGSVLTILPLVAAFLFESKGRYIPATVCAVVMIASKVIPSVRDIGVSLDFFQISSGAWIIDVLFSLLVVIPSVALLVFTVKKEKDYHVWIVIGTCILLFYVILILCKVFILGSVYGIRLATNLAAVLAEGLVYFFGMINVQRLKKRQERRNGKYALLEEYKKNRQMMN